MTRFEDYCRWRAALDDPFVELDLSHAGLQPAAIDGRRAALGAAIEAMAKLEAGAVANPDENRMVGHYWLRAPGRAPTPELGDAIVAAVRRIEELRDRVRAGALAPPEGGRFQKVVMVGIGGSALGPQLLADALAPEPAPMRFHLFDNTDPDGFARELARIGTLRDALVLVASKSGGTPETRNGMLELQAACARERLAFAPRAIAITMPGSRLDGQARGEQWAASLPVWDWVGGRTSLTSAVGLLPAALLGIDVRGLLAGAAAMDECTRAGDPWRNPAALLAAFWHEVGGGRGEKAMVVLPYRDRLLLLSRYLQQLVMESLGKRLDRQGRAVHAGLAVYGNKGSTDQHAFVQQLRDGRDDFFATFVRVLHDGAGEAREVEPGVTSGDYLDGFWQGTRRALADAGRVSATIELERLDERSLGAVVALFERAVGLYAELIDVNAYHQPGVEAGKQAAAAVLARQRDVARALDATPRTCAEVAARAGHDPADVWPLLRRLAASRRDVRAQGAPDPHTLRFRRG
jgi:glucose-6-phosphate isomerase